MAAINNNRLNDDESGDGSSFYYWLMSFSLGALNGTIGGSMAMYVMLTDSEQSGPGAALAVMMSGGLPLITAMLVSSIIWLSSLSLNFVNVVFWCQKIFSLLFFR